MRVIKKQEYATMGPKMKELNQALSKSLPFIKEKIKKFFSGKRSELIEKLKPKSDKILERSYSPRINHKS